MTAKAPLVDEVIVCMRVTEAITRDNFPSRILRRCSRCDEPIYVGGSSLQMSQAFGVKLCCNECCAADYHPDEVLPLVTPGVCDEVNQWRASQGLAPVTLAEANEVAATLPEWWRKRRGRRS